jgi:hypothetical protein
MTALEFFEHDAVQFPLERGNQDFQAFVDQRLTAYLDLIRNMKPGDNITTAIKHDLARIEELCRLLAEAIREYLAGLPHRAYGRLRDGITAVRDAFETRIVTNVTHQFLNELYRMRREKETGRAFTKGEMFHVPFQERHKVIRQRYSIPGLPCVYLGGSIFICWEELGRPSLDSVHLARFQPAPGQSISVLDFMARPKHIAEGLRLTPGANDDPEEKAKFHGFALVWPLMATAAIRRRHDDAPFIAEYIVPQLILQWITAETDPALDAIAYSSVRCRMHVYYPAAIANLVFPAKTIVPSGFCPGLVQKLALTVPVPWQVLARVDYPSSMPSCAGELFEFVAGHPIPYLSSQFCNVEGKFRALPAAVLT